METTKGKLQLVIRSEKMTRIVEFDVPLMTPYGKVGVTRRRARVYEYVFDQRQTRALTEARELARQSGLVLEVIDLTRQSALRRILRLGVRWISPEVRPVPGNWADSKSTSAEPQERCGDVTSPVSLP